MTRRRVSLFVAALLVVPGLPARGETPPDPLRVAAPLRVAMTGSYMPMHGWLDGTATGYEADLARALARHLGRDAVFLDRDALGVPCLEAVASGKADVGLCAITITPERAEKVGFVAIKTLRYLLVGMQRRWPPGEQTSPASGRTKFLIGAVSDLAAQAAREHFPDCDVERVPSTAAGLKLIKGAQLDYLALEDVAAQSVVAARGKWVWPVYPPFGRSQIGMAVPKDLVSAYQKAVEDGVDKNALDARWRPGGPLDTPGAAMSWLASCLVDPNYRYSRSHGARPAPAACTWIRDHRRVNRRQFTSLCQEGETVACVGLALEFGVYEPSAEWDAIETLLYGVCERGNKEICRELEWIDDERQAVEGYGDPHPDQ